MANTDFTTQSTNTCKYCRKCGLTKPLSAFSRDMRRPDGLGFYCRECRNASHREWYLKNRKDQLEKNKVRRDARPEYEKERHRRWRQNNRDASRAHEQKRRARERAINGSFTASDIEAIRKAQGDRCYLCGKSLKRGFHVDHFIPFSKGGSNDPGNLRLACPKCNMQKHDKHPFELGVLL